MKNFLFECLFLLLTVLLSGLALFYIKQPLIVDKIQSIKNKVEIVNLGTSHGDDFDYSYCDLLGKNVNREGNTLYYDLQNYIYLKENNLLKDNAIIVVPVSYHVFGLDENRSDRYDDSFVNDFYAYLPDRQIFSFSQKKKNNLIVSRIQENSRKIFLSVEKRVFGRGDKLNLSIDQSAKYRVDHHMKLSTFSSPDKNLIYLEKLILEIQKDQNRAVLVTTPFYKSYNEHWDKNFLENNYYKYIFKTSEKFNIPYLDYSRDKRFSERSDYFLNSDHLNEIGIKKFSSIFCKEVQSVIN